MVFISFVTVGFENFSVGTQLAVRVLICVLQLKYALQDVRYFIKGLIP